MKIPKIKISRRLKIILAVPAALLLVLAILVVQAILQVDTEQTTANLDEYTEFVAYRLKADPAEEPPEEIEQMQLLILGQAVEAFREGAVMAPDMKAVADLPGVAPRVFREFLKGEITAKFPYIWPYVMAGSVTVMGHTLSAEPAVAFYNPYFDAVLLTKWEFKNDRETGPGFILSEAIPVTGRAFLESRATLATDQPLWADATSELFEARVVNATQTFTAAFEERYPPFARESAVLTADANGAVSLVEDRVFFLLRWVIDAQDPSAKVNYAAGIKDVRDALSASSSAQLAALLPKDNPQDAELIFALERDIREGMKPYWVVDRNVIFINPTKLPKVFLSVYFEPNESGYKPALVALFNLGATYPGN